MRSFSIAEFCQAHGLSRSFFYKLAAQGEAPRIFKVGKLTRISEQANNEWLAKREAASRGVAA